MRMCILGGGGYLGGLIKAFLVQRMS